MTLYINQTIIEEFLYNKFDNFICAINNYNNSIGEDMYNYTEDDHDWFWDEYESFAFLHYVFNPKHIFNNNNIISQINNDYTKGTVDIHDESYIHHEYLIEYALHEYCLNKEKIKNDLINYVDTTIILK